MTEPLTERERWLLDQFAQRLEHQSAVVPPVVGRPMGWIASVLRGWLLAEPAPASPPPEFCPHGARLEGPPCFYCAENRKRAAPSSPPDGGSTAEPVVPRSASVANAPAEQSRGAAAIRQPTTATPEGSHTPLLPCPFCGGVPHANADISAVNCASCKAIMPRDYRVANAVYWWNQRAPTATPTKEYEQIAMICLRMRRYADTLDDGDEARRAILGWITDIACAMPEPTPDAEAVMDATRPPRLADLTGLDLATVQKVVDDYCARAHTAGFAAGMEAAAKAARSFRTPGSDQAWNDALTVAANAALALSPAAFDEGFRAGVEAAAKVAVQNALDAEQHPDGVNSFFSAQTARRIEREIAALSPASAPTLDEGFKAGVEAAAQKVRYASRPEHYEAAGGRVVMYWTVACRDLADMVAALTPAAAADPLLPGLIEARRIASELGFPSNKGQLGPRLDAEIARRAPKGET